MDSQKVHLTSGQEPTLSRNRLRGSVNSVLLTPNGSVPFSSLTDKATAIRQGLDSTLVTAFIVRSIAHTLVACEFARLSSRPVYLIDHSVKDHNLTKALEARGIGNLVRFTESEDCVGEPTISKLDLPKAPQSETKEEKVVCHVFVNSESEIVEERPPQDVACMERALTALTALIRVREGQRVIIQESVNPLETTLFVLWALEQGGSVSLRCCGQALSGSHDPIAGNDADSIAVITDQCMQQLSGDATNVQELTQFERIVCLAQQLSAPIITLCQTHEKLRNAVVITSPRGLLSCYVSWHFNGDDGQGCVGRVGTDSQAMVLTAHLEPTKGAKPGVLWLSSPYLRDNHPSVVRIRDKTITSTGVEVIERSDGVFTPIVEDLGQNRTDARNDIESKLLEILNKHLDNSISGVSDPFVATAQQNKSLRPILAEINRTFSLTLTKSTAANYDSVAKLSNLAARSHAKLDNMVIKLNKAKDCPPLFFVCGIALYGSLAKNLVKDFSCYGIYIPEEDSFIKGDPDDVKGITLEQLATKYVEAIKEHTPQGPYCLAGSSFGGVVAFEVARQLTSKGEIVTGLVLLDTMLPGVLIRTWRSFARAAGKKIQTLWRDLRGGLSKNNPLKADAASVRRNKLQATLRGHRIKCYFASQPKYDGQTLIVRAQDQGGHYVPDDLCWGSMLRGKVHTAAAPGGHLEILQAPETAKAIAALH